MKFLDHFSRITSGRAVIPQIDGLRFVAIMGVVAYHVRLICSYYLQVSPAGTPAQGDLVNDFFDIGNRGVVLFFCVSGFILSVPFARHHLLGEKPVRLRDFYLRRVTRIEPPYVIHLAILLALCFFIFRFEAFHQAHYHGQNWAAYSLKHILASLLYVNGFIYGVHPYPNFVLWSLEVEVQFYILAPFLARGFMIADKWKRRGLLLCSMVALTLASQQLAQFCENPYRIVFSLAGNLQFFLAGFLLADLYLTGDLTVRPRAWAWDFVIPAVLVADTYFRNSTWNYLFLPFLILIFAVGAFRGKAAFRILGNPWVATIGGMCYTIYMYHCLLISLFARLTCRWQTHILWLDMLMQFLVMSGPIIIISAILFALFERPFMRKDWPARLGALLTGRRKAGGSPGSR